MVQPTVHSSLGGLHHLRSFLEPMEDQEDENLGSGDNTYVKGQRRLQWHIWECGNLLVTLAASFNAVVNKGQRPFGVVPTWPLKVWDLCNYYVKKNFVLIYWQSKAKQICGAAEIKCFWTLRGMARMRRMGPFCQVEFFCYNLHNYCCTRSRARFYSRSKF